MKGMSLGSQGEATCFLAGSGPDIDWAGLCWTSLGTMMAAASANTLNQVREVWQDSQMQRTCRRPLPAGRVSRLHAVALAATLGVGSLGVLASQVNSPRHLERWRVVQHLCALPAHTSLPWDSNLA